MAFTVMPYSLFALKSETYLSISTPATSEQQAHRQSGFIYPTIAPSTPPFRILRRIKMNSRKEGMSDMVVPASTSS